MAEKNTIQNLGTLKAFDMMLVQKKQNAIGENGDYFYNLGFTDGTNMLVLTGGKAWDDLQAFSKYDLGLDYVDKKLKLVNVINKN